jgi:serine/threonine protein kinase
MTIIFNKYKLIDKIGKGTYGEIYKGVNIRTNENVAIKIENIHNEIKILKNEANTYNYLNNSKGIPIIKWYGTDKQNNYMIINLLGKSLEYLKQQQTTLSITLILKIGIQILELLELIHNKGIIHRDIKPDNFLFGLNQQSNQIYIIDFGFCKTYLTPNNTHILMKQRTNLIGTPNYASINSHNYIELSRRDDIESLGYMLLYLYLGYLPWEHIYNNDNIKQLKIDITNQNIPHVFYNYFIYVRQLKFEEKPNYSLLICEFKDYIRNPNI